MIIVLEGPDGSGKTTLAQHLVKKYDAHYMHLTYRFKDRMFTYHTAALERALAIEKTGKMVVIDRWWPSINIYDDVFRKRRTFPMAGRMLDRAGMHGGVVYVLCLPMDREQHLKEFEARRAEGGEMYDTVEEICEGYQLWENQNSSRVDVITYDRFYHGGNLDRVAGKIRERWFDLNRVIPHWFQGTRLTGGNVFDPKIMIIGEQSNPKGRHKVWPFYEHGHSSLWLTETLDQANIPESNIVWANAIDEEGWSSPSLLSKLYGQTAHTLKGVVALGGRARDVAHIAGIPKVLELYHPAYVKRFQGGDNTDYINMFRGI